MKNNPSQISFNSISKYNEDYNSSITMNTINPNIANLSFRVKFETKFGQAVYIIGNIEELGQWDTSKAIPMFTNNDIYPTWKIKTDFICPLGMEIYYKYLVKDGNKIIWEDLGQNINRHIIVQSPGNLIIFDEKSNNISKIKTSGFNQITSGNINLSNTDYNLFQNLISETSFKQNVFINNNNNNILSSGLFSNQSLSSYQKQSEYSFQLNEGENNNNFENFSSKDNDSIEGEEKNLLTNNSNKENYSQFEILNIGQGIRPDDKIVIVTTFLPFILDIKDNFIYNDNNNNDSLDISDSKNILNDKYKIILYEEKLVNLILYQLKVMNYCKVFWVGMLPGINDYPEELQYEIFDFLQSQNIFVVLPKKNDFFNFQMYINKILNPIYNNFETDISPYFITNKENYYNGYSNINKNFADTIISISDKEPKMILINDIDLALIPSFLLTELGKFKFLKKDQMENANKLIGGNNICFTLNGNFPDYNTLSLLHMNKELLKSILLCDSLGFHSFSQAKNFLDAIKIYFNANYKVKFNGEIFVEYLKREIPIFIRDIHVKVESMKNIYKNFYNKDKANIISNDNKIINLFSIDSIGNVDDILNKLNIFFDLNKNQFLGYKYKLEIIIVKDRYTDEYLNAVNEKNQKIINDKIKVLKENIGQESNLLLKIQFVDFITVKDQIKNFFNCDVFLFSDLNIWNGMKPLIQEFIIIQNEILLNRTDKNNVSNKIVGLIVNENMTIQEELKLTKRVNFYEIDNVKNILKEIIEISPEERFNIINNDCDQLQKSSSIIWIKDLLSQLKKVFVNNKNKERIGEGYGMDFSYYFISKSFTRLNQKKLQTLLQNSSHKLFLINIKTIFTNINDSDKCKTNFEGNFNIDNVSISDSFIDNNKKVMNILNELSLDKNNKICLFTNESKDIFKEINLNPNNFYFIAEDGLITKSIGEQNFKNKLIWDNNWKKPVIQLFRNFINKTGVGNIIVKEYSVSWNYEYEERKDFLLGNELKFLLENLIDNKKFDIILGNNYLEVKIKYGNNKKYEYINEIINEDKNLKLIFALNCSDKSGDEFFDYLHNKKRCLNDNIENINLVTAIIGRKASKASFYLKDIHDFINIFNMKNI